MRIEKTIGMLISMSANHFEIRLLCRFGQVPGPLCASFFSLLIWEMRSSDEISMFLPALTVCEFLNVLIGLLRCLKENDLVA